MQTTIPRLVFIVLFLIVGGNCLAYDGKLLDGVTGAPMDNVWVVGHWDTGGGFVISSSGCVVAVTRTNSKGEFTLVGRGGGLLNSPFGMRSRPVIYFYKPAYRERTSSPDKDADPFYLDLDDSPTLKRLDRLILMLGQTDCGEKSNAAHKTELLPLYREINAESKEIAKTPREQKVRGAVQWYVDLLEVGYDEAIARARADPTNLIHLPARSDEK